MQIEDVLRHRRRRLTAGVRAVPPPNPWPDLIADEPDDWVAAGARRVCILSPDLWDPVRKGMVGFLYRNLALELASAGHDVTLLYPSPARGEETALSDLAAQVEEHKIHLVPLPDPQVRAGSSIVSRQGRVSYAVLEWLRANEPFDVVHAPETGGYLYHSLWAKRTALALHGTTFVVGTHGGRWWDAEGNFRVLDDLSSLLQAEMELRCVELADVVVSPSQQMLHWLESHYVVLPERTFVWPNVVFETGSHETLDPQIRGLAFFGVFEPRVGVHLFLQALRTVPNRLLRDLPIWLIGERSPVFNLDVALDELRSDRPGLVSTVRTDLSYDEAISIMRNEQLLVVAPALLDDGSLSISACIAGGLPLVATDVGGVREMLHPSIHERVLCDPSPPDVTEALVRVLESGGTVPVAAETADVINSVWCEWHAAQPEAAPVVTASHAIRQTHGGAGDVTVCVVHHEQPGLLPVAIEALVKQTLPPARIIVVDNGSKSEDSKALLHELAEVGNIDGVELTILRGKNRYPGAARNRAARAAQTKYLVFADDDNVAKPHMIETFVQACESDPETACFTCFADYFHSGDEPAPSSVTYRGVFLGGMGMLGAMENAHGDSNAIIRRPHFEAVGGFHELWGVGREDQDLFLRLSAGGYGVGVVPEALFFYRMRDARIRRRHISREAGPSLVAMSGAATLDRDVRLLVEGARGLHDRIGTLDKRVRSLRTEVVGNRGEMKVVRGNLRSLEKRLEAERQRLRATEQHLAEAEQRLAEAEERLAEAEERLAEASAARSDLRWLLRRLDGTPAKHVLRRFAGYRTLLQRYL